MCKLECIAKSPCVFVCVYKVDNVGLWIFLFCYLGGECPFFVAVDAEVHIVQYGCEGPPLCCSYDEDVHKQQDD